MFVDLDWPLNTSSLLSASAELLVIKADESPETRKQKTMERLKKKAENRGETVSVTNDGVLVIDNIPVFSMQRGFVNRRVNGYRDNQDGWYRFWC